MRHAPPSLWQRLSNGRHEPQALAFLRFATGLFFLYVGYEKFNNPNFPTLMAENLKLWANSNPILVYQAFVETVVLPNGIFFAKFIAYAEMGIGISYILGLFLRYSAPTALFLNINFMLATQHTGTAALGINLAFILIHVTLLWAQAGHCYGLDALFDKNSSHRTTHRSKKSTPQKTLQRAPKAVSRPSPSNAERNSKKLKAVKEALAKSPQARRKVKSAPHPERPAAAPPPAPDEKPFKKGIIDLRD